MIWTYRADQEDPAYVVEWRDRTGALIDFSNVGYTYQLKLNDAVTGTLVLTKTTNITGAATAPNVTVAWGAAELNVAPGRYRVSLKATLAGRDRIFAPADPDIVVIVAAPA